MKTPATEKQIELRAKLQRLVAQGVNGERAAAQAKLSRLESRVDFDKPALNTADIFAGCFYKSSVAEPILSYQPDDSDIANAIKWAVQQEAGIECVWRDGLLLACATPTSAKQLEGIARTVAENFVTLWRKMRSAGINPADRGNFIAGLADGMLNEQRQGTALPTRTQDTKTKKAKKRSVGFAPGLHLHPYSVALNLGKQIRFSVPLENIAGELDQAIKGAIAA